IRDRNVTGVQTCALPILKYSIALNRRRKRARSRDIKRRTLSNNHRWQCVRRSGVLLACWRSGNRYVNKLVQYIVDVNISASKIKIGRASCREREEESAAE